MNTHNYIDTNYLHDNSGENYSRNSNEQRKEQEGLVQVSHWLFMAALFVLPLIFLPIAGWTVPVGKVVVTALLGLSAGTMAFAARTNKSIVVPKIFTISFVGILALLVLSTIFSDSMNASLFGANLEVGTFFTTAIALILALVAPVILVTRKQLAMALLAILGGGAVLALLHILRIFLGAEVLSLGYFFDPSTSPVGSWYDLGVFFSVIYLISLASLSFGSFPSNIRVVFWTLLGVSLLLVGFSGLGILILLLGVATLVFLAITFISSRSKTIIPAAVSVVVLLVLLLTSGPISNILRETVEIQYGEAKPTWTNTQEMISAGLSDPKNIVLGKGPNTFTYLWQESRTQQVIDDPLWWPVDFPFASGLIPTFSVTFGLLITGLMVAFVGYLSMKIFGVMRKETSDPFIATIAIASGSASIFLWVFSFFHVFSVVPFFLMFILTGISVATLARMGYVSTISSGNKSEMKMVWAGAGAVVCLLLVLPMLVISTSRTIYGQAVIRAQTATSIEEIIGAQRLMQRASELERSDIFARIETELGLLRLQEFLSREDADEGDIPDFQVVAAEISNASARAINFNPRNYLNYVNDGLVFETFGLLEFEPGYEIAASRYAEAAALNPTNPAIPLMSARLEILRGNQEEAIAFAEKALEIKANYNDAHLFLADVALAEEDTEGAIAQLNKAIEASNSMGTGSPDPFLHFQLGLIHYAEEDYEAAEEQFTTAIISYSDYANARYFRALARVYGDGDREGALQDLQKIAEVNTDNQVLMTVIENIEEGRDPLEGLEDENANLTDEGNPPATNADAARELENESNPENLDSTNTEESTTNTDTSPDDSTN